jgi:predicted ferric reductase
MSGSLNSLPREPTLADAVWGGAGIAFGILSALALTGQLPVASGVVWGWLTQAGRFLGAPPAADAQVYWHMARSAGVTAYLLLWASTAWGLMVTNKVLDGAVRPLITFELHQFLSILALAFSGFHAFILLGDRYIDFSAADLLIPFKSPYEPAWVGLGILSFYLTGMLVVSFYLKKRIGHRVWRRLHYASFLSWVMATFHGLMSGSDSGTWLMLAVYVVTTLSVAFLTMYRILTTKPKGAPSV